MMPHDLPPWHAVYQQSRRWLEAGVFDAIVHDLRSVLRVAQEREEEPSAVIMTMKSVTVCPHCIHSVTDALHESFLFSFDKDAGRAYYVHSVDVSGDFSAFSLIYQREISPGFPS